MGYVTEEDWDGVVPTDFMQQIKDVEVELNTERELVGITPFFTDGWRQEPVFDAPAHTAYWGTDLSSGPDRWINATALRLSRSGYHQIIWAGSSEGFAAAQATLGSLLRLLLAEAPGAWSGGPRRAGSAGDPIRNDAREGLPAQAPI